MPWKNGGGSTIELAIEPKGASLKDLSFTWRLSLATVASDGPFSEFPGFDRLLTVVRGAGMELKSKDSAKAGTGSQLKLDPQVPVTFSGDLPLEGKLRAGELVDLGLIFRRGGVRAKGKVVAFKDKPRSFELSARTVFLFALSGNFAVSAYPGEYEFELTEGAILRLDRPDPAVAAHERLVMLEPQGGNAKVLALEVDW